MAYKRPLTVIADDITGAAEIAGIGYRYGLRTVLSTEPGDTAPDCDVWVIATDTRSMSKEEAVAETRRIVEKLQAAGAEWFFKKTDSALRGHVGAELATLLSMINNNMAFYIPCNPSKGRVIRNGRYYINGTPIHKTAFSYDPEFPITSPEVSKVLHHDDNDFPTYINYMDMETESHLFDFMRNWYGDDDDFVFAGAADLFTAYIRCYFKKQRLLRERQCKPFGGLKSGKALIVCGSTQSGTLREQPYVVRYNIPDGQMPVDVFEGTASASTWLDAVAPTYAASSSVILSIGYPSKGGKDFALRLRHTMAETVASLTALSCPKELIIEGGATAYAVLKALGWKNFRLTNEVAPGVVRMKCEDATTTVHVTLKPGSYNWGGLFAQ